MRWAWIAILCAAAGLGGAAIGAPSPAIFAGLAVGLLVALRTTWDLDLPDRGMRLSQAVLGVSLGLLVQGSTLRELGGHAAPVLVITLLTLAVTVVCGLAMSRLTGMDRPTAAFGTIAGGASGIVAISRDLGADERLVAVMQYLRVLVIVVLAPLVAAIAGGSHGVSAVEGGALDESWWRGLLTVVACVVGGGLLVRVTRLPAGALLGPLLIAAALSIAGVPQIAAVPEPLLQVAYVGIGLAVGLRFTVASIRAAARIVPATLLMIAVLIIANAGLGLLLVPLADVGALDAYLATTPGGLYVVLAAASTANVDATFVLSVQVLRLFVMILAAPLLARVLTRRPGPAHPAPEAATAAVSSGGATSRRSRFARRRRRP